MFVFVQLLPIARLTCVLKGLITLEGDGESGSEESSARAEASGTGTAGVVPVAPIRRHEHFTRYDAARRAAEAKAKPMQVVGAKRKGEAEVVLSPRKKGKKGPAEVEEDDSSDLSYHGSQDDDEDDE